MCCPNFVRKNKNVCTYYFIGLNQVAQLFCVKNKINNLYDLNQSTNFFNKKYILNPLVTVNMIHTILEYETRRDRPHWAHHHRTVASSVLLSLAISLFLLVFYSLGFYTKMTFSLSPFYLPSCFFVNFVRLSFLF